jgi:3-hydroxyisobutyrate dehydrogenase-like beta-hydroxyacid dehydrogenase
MNHTSPSIGLIGVGLMGHGIARNLLKHGHALTVLEHSGNQPLDELLQMQAKTTQSAQALASGSDVLILCVTGSPQVEDVLLGERGALQAITQNAIVIDCSTALPTSTERVAQAVHAAGGRFVDAAMTRTAKEAHEGRLNLLVGADAATFDQVRPLLACFAENITHCGPVGAGHRMKLLHNSVSLGFIALLAEVAACAQRSGIDPQVLVEVLAKGGGASAALDRLKPFILTGDSSGLKFAMGNAQKDLGYYTQMASDQTAVSAIAQAVHATYAQATLEAGAEAMVPELVALLAKR